MNKYRNRKTVDGVVAPHYFDDHAGALTACLIDPYVQMPVLFGSVRSSTSCTVPTATCNSAPVIKRYRIINQ